MVQLSQPHMTTGKAIALIIWTFVSKVMSLLTNTPFRFVIAFLPRSKCLLISWLQSPSSDSGAQENKVCYCFHCFPMYLPWSDGTRCHDFHFLFFKCWVLSQIFYFPLSPSSKGCLLSTIRVVSSAYLRLSIFLPAILIPACTSSSLAFCMMYSALWKNSSRDGNNRPPNLTLEKSVWSSGRNS